MKIIIYLLFASVVLLLFSTILQLLHGPLFLIWAAAVLLMALLILAIVLSMKQSRMMTYLIEESKKQKKTKTVLWKEEDAQELQLVKKRVELSFLQQQINPHFLYNTLDSIRSRALTDGQEEIARMTEILSRFFRYCISNNDNLVRVREELGHIEDYYYIQKYRFEDRFEMKVNVEQDEIYDLYLPKMTLQPLVENAMVHGLEQVEHKGLIELHLFRTDRNLMIVISDNGIGMSREQLNQLNAKMQQEYMSGASKRDRHNGIAAHNVNTRLKITFGEESGIRYRSLEGAGTDAVITLPAVDVFTRVKYENQYER
jgi:two-component system sensor histidine kinase YesM